MEEINLDLLSNVTGGAREELSTPKTTGEGRVGNMMTQTGGANPGERNANGVRQMVGPGSPAFRLQGDVSMGKIHP